MSENLNFSTIKNDILDFIKENQQFDRCYVVRNIYSRFAIYILNPFDFEDFSKKANDKFNNIIDLIQIISENDKFIYADLNETSDKITDKIFFAERHVENSNWFIKEPQYLLDTPVTSFYSFKGGVGRTTATVMSALLLARKGKKVLIVDFDLEAPGLASMFANADDNTEDILKVKGFVDFLIDYEIVKRDINKIDINDYYFVRNEQILVGNNGGELVIVPAIATDSSSASSYIDKLSKASLRYNSAQNNYLPDIFLKQIEQKIKPDYIFIDTRTGINDVGGLVFNRYAQNIFLLFYGNRQNMFGLESMLPELKQLYEEKNILFYLVNSPVPKNPTDEKAEIDFFIENSYEFFCNNFYDKENLPSMFDESETHYPINIHYNEQALILNNFRKIAAVLESSRQEYEKIADIIVSSNNNIEKEDLKLKSNEYENILDLLIGVDKGAAGISEVEYQNETDLTNYFYPRKDYKFIFDKDKFLILGEKGVGKTALFSVLSHSNYAKELAKYCGIANQEIAQTNWLIGLDKDKDEFPNKENFESLKDFTLSELRNYWMILLLRQLNESLINDDNLKFKNTKIRELKNMAKLSNIGEDLFEQLKEINNGFKSQNKVYIFVYDHLDATLPTESNLRGRLVSALLSLFYDNINTFSNIKAKIFLRKDIFDKEVKDITDKVKIQNYKVEIEWDYTQILNIIWKRIYQQNENISLLKRFFIEKKEILGAIPDFDENTHKSILDKIFGETMGGNNKAYPYNWVKLHVEDTNNQIHPRALIKLFSESARLQKEDKSQLKDRVIRSKNIETALREKVSNEQVQELKEEYKELETIFSNLSEKVGGRSPINESDFLAALEKLGIEKPLESIDRLKSIGVLKDYKPSKDKTEDRRYHIPDLYLFGMGFTRKGTG